MQLGLNKQHFEIIVHDGTNNSEEGILSPEDQLVSVKLVGSCRSLKIDSQSAANDPCPFGAA